MWEAASGAGTAHAQGAHRNHCFCCLFSDSQRIVTGSVDQTSKLWGGSQWPGSFSRSRGTALLFILWPFPRTASGLSPAVGITAKVWEAASGGNCSRSRGTTLGFCLWPFPRTASGLSPAVGIRRPRCGRRPAAGNCSRSRGTALRFGLWRFRQTASGLSLAVTIRRPRCGTRPAVGNCSRSRGTALGFGLWPFPRTASGLSLAVTIRRPKVWDAASGRGTAYAQRAQRFDQVCGLFPGRPADCHRQLRSDGQGAGRGQRSRTVYAQGARASG